MGSSPLTRGKQSRSYSARRAIGLIPAHAGKTSPLFGCNSGHKAHPRSRGENGNADHAPAAPPGSSPLTRGKLCDLIPVLRCQRLIPAHAGKTSREARPRARSPAHPRSRGENLLNGRFHLFLLGSSPLTRGKRRQPPGNPHGRRLIPAHAGKTRRHRPRRRPTRAHPRSRGENGQKVHSGRPSGGSSPLTRGKQGRGPRGCGRSGLIPAHAGKTCRAAARNGCSEAHPRSRGENDRRKSLAPEPLGSSPLTRGKRLGSAFRGWSRRLIPAHAGKTRRA